MPPARRGGHPFLRDAAALSRGRRGGLRSTIRLPVRGGRQNTPTAPVSLPCLPAGVVWGCLGSRTCAVSLLCLGLFGVVWGCLGLFGVSLLCLPACRGCLGLFSVVWGCLRRSEDPAPAAQILPRPP